MGQHGTLIPAPITDNTQSRPGAGGNGLISGLVVIKLPPPVLTTSSGVTRVTISGEESISLYGTTILSWETGGGF